jgi:hypothetical protein
MPVIHMSYDDGNIHIPFKTIRELFTLLKQHITIAKLVIDPAIVPFDILDLIYRDLHINDIVFDESDVLTNPDKYWIITHYKDINNINQSSNINLDTTIMSDLNQIIYIEKRTKTYMIQCFLSNTKSVCGTIEMQNITDKKIIEQYYKNAEMIVLEIPEIIYNVYHFKQQIALQLCIDQAQIMQIVDYESTDLYISHHLSFVTEIDGYNCNRIWYIQIDGFKSSKKEEIESILKKYTIDLIEILKQSDEYQDELHLANMYHEEAFDIDLTVKENRDKIDKLIDTIL